MTFSTIGDHVELQRGTTYKSALLDQPGPVLLGLGSIERDGGFRSDKLRTYGGPSSEKLLVRPGDLYVSLKDVTQSGDLLGAIARVPESIYVGRMTQDTVKLIFKSDIPKDYFFWLLRTPQYRQYCRSHATGTTNLGLSRDDFFGFKIPDLDAEKRLLIDSLENLEAKILTNHQINQTLEQMAQAIFKSWFVDFEPVKAKIAALEAGGSEEDALLAAMQAISGKDEAELSRLQAEQPEQYTELRTTAKLFPSAMQDSELGEIPEGWAYGTLSDIASFSNNRIPKHELTLETYISTENMFENKKGVCPASSLPSSASVPGFELGEILISNIRPYFKKIWLANISGGRSPDVLGFSPKQKGTNEYLFNLLYQDGFFDYMMLTSKGAKMPRGDKKAVMQFTTVVPPIDLMRHFSGRVKSFYALATSHNRESKSLVSVRDTILPKLLSGELSIKGAGDQVPKAAELANV